MTRLRTTHPTRLGLLPGLLALASFVAGCNGAIHADADAPPMGTADGGLGDPADQKGDALDAADAADESEEEIYEADFAVASHGTHVGVNYNGQLDAIDFDAIERTNTQWVRGVIDVFLYHENPARYDAKIAKFLELKRRGYRTVLNIKWNFHHKSFPEPGSARMAEYQAYLRPLLLRVWPGTDVIVSGNEPFIESKRDERDGRLVAFYREMTNYMVRFRKSRPRKIPIYVGSFQNPHSPAFRIAAARDLLAYAKGHRGVAGVDLHIHHQDGPEITTAFQWVHGKIRANQRILVTEFSLMHHFRSRLGETIPGRFADAHGLPRSMRNFEYIDRALKRSVNRAEWVDFLRQSPWFENRKHYLRNAYQQMSSFPKFFVATYGIRQSYPPNVDFTRQTDPWILNALYANRTVTPAPNGADRFNYAWIDDFHAIQRGDFD